MVRYPNKELIQPCASHVKDRECFGSVKKEKEPKAVLFRFIPQTYIKPGMYLPDLGETFEKNILKGNPWGNVSYIYILGWSLSMKDRMFLRQNPSDPNIETHVQFPPSSTSRYCTSRAPQNLCEPVTWSVLAGKGLFKITIMAGDPIKKSRLDLTINGKIVAKAVIIEANKIYKKEEILESKDSFFHFISECHENCDDAVSILSSIQMEPHSQDEEIPKKHEPEKQLSCGVAFTGGKIFLNKIKIRKMQHWSRCRKLHLQ